MLHLVVSECNFYSSSHITATTVPLKSDLHHILSPPKKRTLSADALLQTEVLCFFYVAEARRSRRLYSIFCVESLSHKIAIPSNCSLRGEPVVCPTITQAAARLKLFHFISRIDFAAISSLSYGNFLHCTICASACFDLSPSWVFLWAHTKKVDLITSVLRSLHLLPVSQRIDFDGLQSIKWSRAEIHL